MKNSVAITVYLLIVILLTASCPVFSQGTKHVPMLSLKAGQFDFGKAKEGSLIS